MTKSTNTEGNPWHDEEGKFTSPDATTLGVSLDDFLLYKKGGNLKLKDNIDLDSILDSKPLKIKDNIDLNSLFGEPTLAESLEFTTSNVEIVKNNILKVLDNSDYINNVALNFNFEGKNTNEQTRHQYYYFGIKKAYNNCIVYELAYTLYPRKAKLISQEEYNQKLEIIRTQGSGQLTPLYTSDADSYRDSWYDDMDKPELRDVGCGLIKVFRALQIDCTSASDSRELKRMYLDGNPINPLFGHSSANSGSLHYFSMRSNHFAMKRRSSDQIIQGIVNLTGKNQNAHIIGEDQLSILSGRMFEIYREYDFKQQMKDTVKKHFVENGYDNPDEKTEKFVNAFIETLQYDEGLTGLLCGAQAMAGRAFQSEFDLYDLSLLEMIDN